MNPTGRPPMAALTRPAAVTTQQAQSGAAGAASATVPPNPMLANYSPYSPYAPYGTLPLPFPNPAAGLQQPTYVALEAAQMPFVQPCQTLEEATIKKNIAELTRLVQLKADPNSPNRLGMFPVMVAAINHDGLTIKHLVSLKADVNIQKVGTDAKHNDRSIGQASVDKTALHFAVASQADNAVSALLELKADTDKTDSGGNTPLHIAAQEGHLGMIRILCTFDADKSIKNNDGKTAAEIFEEQTVTAARMALNDWPVDLSDLPDDEA